jgi:hypothetical protein
MAGSVFSFPVRVLVDGDVWLARIAFRRRGTIHLREAATIGMVAGVVASAIVWKAATEKRLELAARDIQSLQRPDNDAALLLRRLGQELSRYDSAGSRADLLKRYAASDVAAADLPLALTTWSATGERLAELKLAPVTYDSGVVARIAMQARDSAQPVIVQTLGAAGREVVMAARHSSGGVTDCRFLTADSARVHPIHSCRFLDSLNG